MADSIYAPHNQHKLDAARAANTTADSPASPASPAPAAATKASDADAAKASSPQPDQHDDAEDRPHPHLTRPLLYISGVDPAMTDKELAGLVFEKVLPVRLKIDRNVAQGQTASGTVEFQTLDKAEKAYAIVRPPFQLSIDAAGADADPVASAKPRLIKQLPANTDDALVYDLFRRFGPLRCAHCLLTNPAGVHTGFKGMAVLDFYSEQDAQLAQTEMHCADVGGKTISVALDTSVRKVSSSLSDFRASAQPFVPGNGLSAAAPSFAPTVSGSRSVSAGSSASIYANPAAAATHDNHAAAAPKGARSLQYSNQASTYVDPCNLFIKNLDGAISSNDLFDTFKAFGHIVSARVMRDNDGKSREFGFVSFTTPDEAHHALQAMDNAKLGARKITVRLHEPKTMRQEKLAARFAAAHGETNEAADASGSAANARAAEPTARADKRQSRSYFQAGVPADANGLADEEQLRSLTGVVRDELLSGEFTRRVQKLSSVDDAQVDGIVSELLKLRLGEAVEALNNPISLVQRVNEAREHLPAAAAAASPTAPARGALSADKPGQLGVQTQRSVSSTSSIGGDGAAAASAKERERLLKAVQSVTEAGAPVEDITDMLASLPKKDRALALFNPEYLRQKVDEAKDIIDITDDSGEDLTPARPSEPTPAAATPTASATSEPAATTASNGASDGKEYTLSSLAALPAVEIVRLASGGAIRGVDLRAPDASVVASTDAFIDSLQGKAAHDQKQKLGDQLFKKVRSLGVKGAPKITIHLLDSEDLRALAHLMNEYDEVLREKVEQKVAAGLNK